MDLIDPKLLQLFDTLYRTRSVTRAAEELGLAQPTVSIRLAQLRTALHDPLFIRSASGMLPTPAADALVGTVRELIEQLRQLSAWESSFVPATATRQFRICLTDASHLTLLPRLLAHVREAAPQVRLHTGRMDASTARSLESGEADLAVGYAPWLDSGFYQQTLFTQDWICLSHPAHPRIGRTLDLRRYREEAHVKIAAGTSYQLLEDGLRQRDIRRKVVLEVPSFLGLTAIVSSTDLIVTLPRSIGQTLAAMGGLAMHDCPFTVPPFEVKQHWHTRYHDDAASRWLRGVLAQLFMRARRSGAQTRAGS